MTLEEKIKNLQITLANGTVGSLVYLSGRLGNTEYSCEPVLLPFKLEYTQYPYVLEAPEGLNNPVYDWSKSQWVEQDKEALGYRLSQAEEKLSTLNTQSEKHETENTETQSALDKIQQSQLQMTQLLSQILASKGGAQ
ncbi:hypothetical protein PUW59_06100 [Lactobacillus mulieris]|nr:hypothetical protein PUW59_06100 [Lactobacillus mulieris]